MIYQNISREDYNKLEGINASKLKPYYESILNGNYENAKPRIESDAMFFGTTTHSMILEPAKFPTLYAPEPPEPTKEDGSKINKNTKVYKEWKASLPTDKHYLNADQWQLLRRIQTNIDNNEPATKILNACPLRETGMTAEIDGFKVKCLVDFMGDSIIGDLKTTRNIPLRDDDDLIATAIFWDLVATRNLLQFSFYYDVAIANDIDIKKFAVIFAKNNGNADVATVFLSDTSIEYGRDMYKKALDNWSNRNLNTGAFTNILEV